MKTVWQNEPIIIIGILVGLVPAVMGVLAAFGVEITSAQIAAVASLLTAIGAAVARSQVTPNGSTSSGDPPTINGVPGAPPKDGSVPPVLRPMKRLALAWACALLVSCTSTQGTVVAQVLADFCPTGVTLVGEPGLAPLCAAIPEVEAVLNEWLSQMNAAAAKGAALPPAHTNVDLYHAVLARRAMKAGAK